MRLLPRCISLWLLLAGYPAPLHGQPTPQTRIAEIQAAYQQLDYKTAKEKALAALADYEAFTPAQLTEIHTLLALVYFSENEPEAARLQFEAALSLTPSLTLDPLLVSPKIRDFFAQVKEGWGQRQPAADERPAVIRYIQVEDRRTAAAIRSFLLPGWGQHYKGETAKGWLFTSLWGAALTGTVVAHLQRRQAQHTYETENDPDRIRDRYASFNAWHKARNNLALATAGIWLLSYLDALITRPAHRSFAIGPGPLPWQPQLYLRLRF